MPLLKKMYPPSLTLRLSRETIVVLDDLAEDFGGISRRAAIEILARSAKAVKGSSGKSYADLLLDDTALEPVNRNGDKKSTRS